MEQVSNWKRLAALALIPAITLILLPIRNRFDIGSILLIQLVAVILAASLLGPIAGVFIAVLAIFASLYFLIPPYETLTISNQNDLIAIVIFVFAAATSGLLLRRIRKQSELVASTEAERRRLQATEEMRTALLASVGHDLRTPIAGIKATVSGLRAGDVDWSGDETSEGLAAIEESTDRLQELVSNLLDMSRLEAGVIAVRSEPTELSDPLNSAIYLSPKLNLRLDIPAHLPLIMTDSVLLERALHNLFVNVHTHTPKGTLVEVVAARYNDKVRVEVIDHGPGLSDLEMKALFTPLPSRDGEPRRRGLGLAIVSGFVSALNGQLIATQTRDGGLTVTILLPKVPE